MARKEIDYSSTLIYKITCKDPAVTDLYVGHTTDFVQRRTAHKQSTLTSACKLYKIIRANGGWLNWTMEILNFYNCKNLHEAKIKEQEHFVALKATLNSIEPLTTPKVKEVKEKKVKKCAPVKETTEVVTQALSQTMKYGCDVCDFKCRKKSNYNAHLLTRKHLEKNTGKEKRVNFDCAICKKQYSSRNGLWKHSKKCVRDEITTPMFDTSSTNINNLINIVLEVIKSIAETLKQNKEIKKQSEELQIQMIELLHNK